MMMFCSKFQEKPYKMPIKKSFQFLKMLKIISKSGSTTKLFGLLTLKRFMIN